MSTDTQSKQCAVCGAVTTQGCSNCRVAFYCSPQHQQMHWPVHRKDCKPQQPDPPRPPQPPKVQMPKPTVESEYTTPKRQHGKSKTHIQLKPEVTPEELHQQRLEEHAIQRKIVVVKIAGKEYQEAASLGRKLIEQSSKLSDTGQKVLVFETIADYLMVAKVYIQLDDLKSARELVQEAQRRLMLIDKQRDAKKVCSVLQLMASLFYACGDFRSCEQVYCEYVKIIESTSGQDSLATSNAYFLVGVFYLQHKHYLQALACFKRALNIRTMKSADGKTEGIADCWYNLGIIFKQTGKKMKAIEMLEKALEIRREMIGDVSLQVAMCLETLGKIFMSEFDYKSALHRFSECFYIRRRLLSNPDSVDLVRISLLILNLYQSVRDQLVASFGGPKMQPILRNVLDRAQLTIQENNLSRYMTDELDMHFVEAQSQTRQFHTSDLSPPPMTEQDHNSLPSRHISKIKSQNYQAVQPSTSNLRERASTEQGFVRPPTQSTGFSKPIRTQEDDFDLEPVSQPPQSDDLDIEEFFGIRKELLQTFTIDQMILLEELCKDLKKCVKLNPHFDLKKNISNSTFIASLSNIQHGILHDDNPTVIEKRNLSDTRKSVRSSNVLRGIQRKTLLSTQQIQLPESRQSINQTNYLSEEDEDDSKGSGSDSVGPIRSKAPSNFSNIPNPQKRGSEVTKRFSKRDSSFNTIPLPKRTSYLMPVMEPIKAHGLHITYNESDEDFESQHEPVRQEKFVSNTLGKFRPISLLK